MRNLVVRNFKTSVLPNDLDELTARECEVLRLLADGLGNKQIAARLSISEHTAKFHIVQSWASSASPAEPKP